MIDLINTRLIEFKQKYSDLKEKNIANFKQMLIDKQNQNERSDKIKSKEKNRKKK